MDYNISIKKSYSYTFHEDCNEDEPCWASDRERKSVFPSLHFLVSGIMCRSRARNFIVDRA